MSTYSDYKPEVSVKTADGSLVTIEGDGAQASNSVEMDPEEQQLLADLASLKERLDAKSAASFERATDVIIHLAVLEKGMPKALGVCLKETEDVILKTIPIIKKDQERKKAARERKLKENPRLANPNKRRRGPKAKDFVKAKRTKEKTMMDVGNATATTLSISPSSSSSASFEESKRDAKDASSSPRADKRPRQRSWTPGTQKVPKYMNQGMQVGDDKWV